MPEFEDRSSSILDPNEFDATEAAIDSELEFRAAFADLDGVGGTTELASAIAANYDAVYQRLRRLEDEGRVRRRKVANANLWLLADADGDREPSSVEGPSEEVEADV